MMLTSRTEISSARTNRYTSRQAVVPRLRAEAVDIELRLLARDLALAAIGNAAWVAFGRTEADAGTPNGGWPPDALDPSTPAGRVTWALDALHMAVGKFQGATGRDGLAVAVDAITDGFSAAIAEKVLRPLFKLRGEPATLAIAIDVLLYDGPLPPTAEECARSVDLLLSHAFQGLQMAVLRSCLDELHDLPEEPTLGCGQDVLQARAKIIVACQAALTAGIAPADLVEALAVWADVTGGARVTLQF